MRRAEVIMISLRRRHRPWAGVWTVVAAVILEPAWLLSQSSAAISGTVRDSSGAVMPGAEIVVKNAATGFTRTVVTNDAGRFSLPQLPLGDYEVTGTLSGFKTEVRRGIGLTVGREAMVDLVLSVGNVAERVEVTGEAPLVETTQSSVAGLVTDQQIRD